MSGKTTRLIDAAIQELFTNGKICIPFNDQLSHEKLRGFDAQVFIDVDASVDKMAQQHFRDKLILRLSNEHDGYFRIRDNMIFAFKINHIKP